MYKTESLFDHHCAKKVNSRARRYCFEGRHWRIRTAPYAHRQVAVDLSIEFPVERPYCARTQLQKIDNQTTDEENVGEKRNGHGDEQRLEFIVDIHDLKQNDND